jgi:hypothetical protein
MKERITHGNRPTNRSKRLPTILLSFRFASVATLGTLSAALVSAIAPLEAQIGLLGALASLLGGLLWSYLEQVEERDCRQVELLKRLAVPIAMAADRELFREYLGWCDAWGEVAVQTDPILREIAALKATSTRHEIEDLAEGRVVFTGTESWRTVYEKILASPDVQAYQSVAYVQTDCYWQDPPGQKCLAANFEAVSRGVLIERIVILADPLWPADDVIPRGVIGDWIVSQHNHGLWICLVRESQLAQEPELRLDFGIYGERAVGVQALDGAGRTLRFTLDFSDEAVRLANERWKKLEVFSVPFAQLLDRSARAR